ncbi:MAG: hypothetical protein ACR2MY_01905 [Candidatus Dormibacteria bacterium]
MPNNRTTIRRSTHGGRNVVPQLAVALTVALTGCGSQASGGSTGSGSMAGMNMGGTTKSAKATLVPSNSITGAGTVTVAIVKNQVHVDVRAQQLTAATRYTVHLHHGSCASIGDIIKSVGDLQTDTAGAGMTNLEYSGSSLPTPAFVDVHAPAGTEGPAVCGDLQ